MTVVLNAGEPPEAPNWCFDMNDADSTCTWTGEKWVKSYDETSTLSDGPSGFGAFIFLGILVTVVLTLWRVSLARRVARDAGLDPNRATELTLLEDHGLEASYLASHLQARPVAEQPSAPAVRTAQERLVELRSLLDRGLLTQEEYDTRRRAVIDAL